jgi:hypothetical protein
MYMVFSVGSLFCRIMNRRIERDECFFGNVVHVTQLVRTAWQVDEWQRCTVESLMECGVRGGMWFIVASFGGVPTRFDAVEALYGLF